MCLLTYSPFWMSLKITILYLQQSECVCVCGGVCVCVSMRAVYLVLLNLSFLCMSLCLCAYCLLSIFKPFISACVCVCVYVTERETVLMNSPLLMCSIVSPAFYVGLPGVSNPAPGELPSSRFQLQPQSNTPEPANHSLQGYWLISDRCVGAGL